MPISIGTLARLRRIVLAAVLASAPLPGATTKGPDAGQYTGTDATVYSFIDISGAGGSASVLANVDDGVAPLTLPFGFQFYGQTYSIVCVSSNGLLTFVTNLSACVNTADFANTDLASAGPPGNPPAILPFWMDLTFQVPGGGSVFYQVTGASPNRKFIVQWNNAYPLGSPNPVTFEVILSEGANQILFQYQTTNLGSGNPASNGGMATVGIRDAGGNTNGRQIAWSYDAPVLANGTAVLFQAGAVQQTTSTTLVTSGSPSTWGQPVTFTATVSPAVATGSVTFNDSANSLGTVLLNSGTAALAVPTLAVGNHSITAVYGGSAGYAASTSGGVPQNITQATTPVLSIAKSHAGNFYVGQTDAAYSVTVSNGAAATATTGSPQVTEVLPSGLAFVTTGGMSGAGWTCSTLNSTCTRTQNDILQPGASYPAIAVTVNVTATSAGTVTNQVSVTGGGSTSTASAGDPTIINASSPCDVKQVGPTVSDVQQVINEATGAMRASHDMNQDGVVNVIEVQLVINWILGMGCSGS